MIFKKLDAAGLEVFLFLQLGQGFSMKGNWKTIKEIQSIEGIHGYKDDTAIPSI